MSARSGGPREGVETQVELLARPTQRDAIDLGEQVVCGGRLALVGPCSAAVSQDQRDVYVTVGAAQSSEVDQAGHGVCCRVDDDVRQTQVAVTYDQVGFFFGDPLGHFDAQLPQYLWGRCTSELRWEKLGVHCSPTDDVFGVSEHLRQAADERAIRAGQGVQPSQDVGNGRPRLPQFSRRQLIRRDTDDRAGEQARPMGT